MIRGLRGIVGIGNRRRGDAAPDVAGDARKAAHRGPDSLTRDVEDAAARRFGYPVSGETGGPPAVAGAGIEGEQAMSMRPSQDPDDAVGFEAFAHDPASAPHPRLVAAYRAWTDAQKIDGIPLRQSLALERMPDALGQVGIVDVLPTGDFRYRMFGSGLVGALGYDATGWRTVDLKPAAYAALITRQYQEVVAARRPILHEVRSSGQDAGQYRYFRLTAPLTLGDGRVDQLWMTVALLGSFGREVFLSDGSPFFRSRD